MTDDDFRRLLAWFNRPWSGYRKVRKRVKKRVRRHMAAVGTPDIDSYLQLLAKDVRVRNTSKKCLQVTISRFFRDRNLWRYLQEKLLPELARENPFGVRLWSIGCGCGEEVYSTNMIWRRLIPQVTLNILATDINPENLVRAEKGSYPRSSLREVPKEFLDACFGERRNNNYTVRQEFRLNIRWLCHDLFSGIEDEQFHIIFLRNSLLTYHQGEERNIALEEVINHLDIGGYLVVGSHERIPKQFTGLSKVEGCNYIYRLT